MTGGAGEGLLGTGKLAVDVPGPGVVDLAGSKLKRVTKQAATGGSVSLVVKAKGKAAKQLRRKGRAKLTAKVTFTPTGGRPNSKSKKLKLKLK